MASLYLVFFFFFFNDPATTEISPLSLHDALPICIEPGPPPEPGIAATSGGWWRWPRPPGNFPPNASTPGRRGHLDRKSTRLNSSHSQISYAVFCLKKKKKHKHARYLTTTRQTTHA